MRQAQALAICVIAGLVTTSEGRASDWTQVKDGLVSRSSRQQHQIVSRALTRKPGHYLYGLHDGKDTKHRYDIALGWTPDFNDPTAISTINAALDKPMSIIGDTIDIGVGTDELDLPLPEIDEHLDKVFIDNPATQPVYLLSLKPMGNFKAVTETVIETVVGKMKTLNDKGITVWLRYAHSMNLPSGELHYGDQAKEFKASWIAMYKAINASAPNTYMLWSPEVETDSSRYMEFHPGDQYIHLHGLSLGFNTRLAKERQNIAPSADEFYASFKPFYDLFHEYPIVIASTAASYNYNMDGKTPVPGTAVNKEAEIKSNWITQLISKNTSVAFPSLIAAVWYERYVEDGGPDYYINADYRSLTGKTDVKDKISAYLNSPEE